MPQRSRLSSQVRHDCPASGRPLCRDEPRILRGLASKASHETVPRHRVLSGCAAVNPPRSLASCAAEVRVGFLNRDETLLCSRLSQQRAAPAARPERMTVRRRRARETDRAQGSLQTRRAPEPVDNQPDPKPERRNRCDVWPGAGPWEAGRAVSRGPEDGQQRPAGPEGPGVPGRDGADGGVGGGSSQPDADRESRSPARWPGGPSAHAAQPHPGLTPMVATGLRDQQERDNSRFANPAGK